MASDLPPELSAELTVLGETPVSARVTLASVGNSRLTLSGAPSVALGSLVKVWQPDRLWLGEVIECRVGGAVVIQVVHALDNLPALSRLANRFLGKGSAETSRTASPTLS